MSIRAQVESLIDVDSYASCWRHATAPPFNEFMKFATTAFETVLPNNATNLKFEIRSTEDGRINTLGSFRVGDDEYEIFGQIVWVSSGRFFRGKPGYRKKVAPVVPPEDKSDAF